jgi:ferric enterobactin receptor
MRPGFLALVVPLLLLTGPATAQTTPSPSGSSNPRAGIVHGTVASSDGQPLPGALVTIHGTSISTATDAQGRYLIAQLRPGVEITLAASAAGFEPEARVLVIQEGRFTADFTLPLAQVTEAVSVTAEIPMLNASDGISKVALSPEQIAVLPSLGEQDIFRAFQLLPGVASNETSSGLYVRGGTPDQNLISYDGFTAYHVDHLFGYFSAFNMDAVERVELSKTASEARHGGRLSGVMDITGKSGSTEKAEFGAGISLLSAHALGSVPLGDKASLLLAGRHSYQSSLYNKILNLVDNGSARAGPAGGRRGPGGGAAFDTQPSSRFYDVNGKLSFQPSANDRLFLSLYHGKDDLDNSRSLEIPAFVQERLAARGIEFDEDVIDITDESGWGNTGLGTQWSRQWGDRAETLLSFGYSKHHNERDRLSNLPGRRGGLAEDNTLDDLTARLAVPIRLGWNHQLELGGQVTSNDVSYSYGTGAAEVDDGESTEDDGPPTILGVLDRQEQGTYYSAYVQDRAMLFGKLVLTPGLRFSRYDRTSSGYLEPRIAASLEVASGLRLKGSWGRNNQFVNRVVREDVLGGNRDFWALSDGELIAVPESTNLVVGASYEISGFLVDAETFRNDQSRLTTFAPRFTPADEGIDYDEYFYQGDGESRGVELLVQKKFGHHTGWVSYTLSKTDYQFPELQADPFPADHDQRHELNLVYTARFGPWTLSGVYVYGSGRPYTEPIGTEVVSFGDGGRTIERVIVGDKNGARLPAYQRLDLSANLDFDLFSGKGTIGLTVFNVGDRANVWYKEFSVVEGEIFENNILLMSRTYNLFLNVRF